MSEKFSSSRSDTAPLKGKLLRSLPNWLTFFRLALIPLFVVLMVDPTPESVRMAIYVFILAAATDYADGLLARRWSAVSDFGKLLDPLADKILVMAALVMLVGQRSDVYGEPWVPAWMVVMVLAREIWVTGLRGVAASQGIIVAASQVGKWKSGLQMAAIVLLLLHDRPFPTLMMRLTCELVGLNFLLISIALSYTSAVQYTVAVLFTQRREREITQQIKDYELQITPTESGPKILN